MADYAGDLGVDQLLGHGVAYLGIGLIVLGDQLELYLLAADGDPGRIGFVDGEARAVLVVLAEVGDAAGEGGDAADLDHHRGRRSLDRGWRGRLLLAAAHQGNSGNHGKRKGFGWHVHGETPFRSGNTG